MCQLDYDGPDFCHAVEVKARKPHKCVECHREIQRGEFYLRTAGKWDGVVKTLVTCSHCSVLTDWLGAECGGWIYGGVIEDVREHVLDHGVPVYGFGLARLVVHAQRNWRRRDGALLPVPDVPPTSFDRRKAATA